MGFNRNGSAADIDELETKLFRQMNGMSADGIRWDRGQEPHSHTPMDTHPADFLSISHFLSASIPSICGW